MPLFIVGIIGLFKRKTYGLYSMFGAMTITVYWPMVCLSTVFYAKNVSGFLFSNYAEYSVLLSLISVYGLWGMWYVYKNKRVLAK